MELLTVVNKALFLKLIILLYMKLKLLFLALTLNILNTFAQNTPLYVGTYTDGDSHGIYKFQFNTETGEITNKTLAIATENPSFITYSPNKAYLYAVNETQTGEISAFKVKKNNTLSFLNKVSSNGAHPCHIATNKTGTFIAVSNYSGGTLSLHTVKTDGSLEEASQVFNHNSNTKISHVHAAKFQDKDLFVADLGRNAVYQYHLRSSNYVLISEDITNLPNNSGPRHFVLTSNGHYIYVINEYGSSISLIKRNNKSFELVHTFSTLDANYKGENACADIHLSKDERFLYGSNRGENTIAVFKRNLKNGRLEKIQSISVHGDWPRNFTLDPTGKFLLVANQKSNNISVFKINKENGKLSFLNTIETPKPVCLLF